MTAVLVTLLTVVSVKVVLVMDSVTTEGLEAVTPLGCDTLELILALTPSGIMESKLPGLVRSVLEEVARAELLLAVASRPGLVPELYPKLLFSPGTPPRPGSL